MADTIINNTSNPDKMKDLQKVLNHALNTWDTAPRWLLDIADGLEQGDITGVTFYTKKPVVKKSTKP